MAVTYAALSPLVEDSAPTSTVTCVEQVPVDVHNVPAPAVSFAALPDVSYTALAPVVECIALAPDTSSTLVCVGDTGFDTSWSRHCRHCEVFRAGDRDYEGQVPNALCRRGPAAVGRRARGYPVAASGLMASAHVSAPERHCGDVDGARDGNRRPGRFQSVGHMVEPGVLTMLLVSAKPGALVVLKIFSFVFFAVPNVQRARHVLCVSLVIQGVALYGAVLRYH